MSEDVVVCQKLITLHRNSDFEIHGGLRNFNIQPYDDSVHQWSSILERRHTGGIDKPHFDMS